LAATRLAEIMSFDLGLCYTAAAIAAIPHDPAHLHHPGVGAVFADADRSAA
jgi:hypothetical protein